MPLAQQAELPPFKRRVGVRTPDGALAGWKSSVVLAGLISRSSRVRVPPPAPTLRWLSLVERRSDTAEVPGPNPGRNTHGAVDEWKSRPAFTRDTLRVRLPSALRSDVAQLAGQTAVNRPGPGSSPGIGAFMEEQARSRKRRWKRCRPRKGTRGFESTSPRHARVAQRKSAALTRRMPQVPSLVRVLAFRPQLWL